MQGPRATGASINSVARINLVTVQRYRRMRERGDDLRAGCRRAAAGIGLFVGSLMHLLDRLPRFAWRRQREELQRQRDQALAERDAYLRQRDEALGERNEILRQRDIALGERNDVLRQHDQQIRLKNWRNQRLVVAIAPTWSFARQRRP